MNEAISGIAIIGDRKLKMISGKGAVNISIIDAILEPKLLNISGRCVLCNYLLMGCKYELVVEIFNKTVDIQPRPKDELLLLISLFNINSYDKSYNLCKKMLDEHNTDGQIENLILMSLVTQKEISQLIVAAKNNEFLYDSDETRLYNQIESLFSCGNYNSASLGYLKLIKNKRYQNPTIWAFYSQSILREYIRNQNCNTGQKTIDLLVALHAINYAIEKDPNNSEWYIIKHSILVHLFTERIYKRPDEIYLCNQKISHLCPNTNTIQMTDTFTSKIKKSFEEYSYIDNAFKPSI